MAEAKSSRHEFKDISAGNLSAVDSSTALWLAMTRGEPSAEKWIEFCQGPVLGAGVPKEVVGLLEAARGAMIYGWFYYPLVTLGAQQCWRVLETGARRRCEQAGIATKTRSAKGLERDRRLVDLVDELLRAGLAGGLDQQRWDAVRRLRNSTSHPESQMLLDPGQARRMLEVVVETLNGLFP